MKIEKKLVILLTFVFCLTTACSMNTNIEKEIAAMPKAPSTPNMQAYLIQPGNELSIKFFYNPELDETLIVRPDGMITLQLIDDVKVAGLTPSEVDNMLTEKYSKELRKPVLSVIVRTATVQQVFIGGEVAQPGLIPLVEGMNPIQAVFQAGGFIPSAKPEAAVVIRKGEGNSPMPMLLDLNQAMYGLGEGASFELQPDDIVYVPKSEIAKVNKFVDEYIRGMLMFNGWSFGFSYRVDDKE